MNNYYFNNREEILKRRQVYYLENKETISQRTKVYFKIYYQENKELIKQRQKNNNKNLTGRSTDENKIKRKKKSDDKTTFKIITRYEFNISDFIIDLSE